MSQGAGINSGEGGFLLGVVKKLALAVDRVYVHKSKRGNCSVGSSVYTRKFTNCGQWVLLKTV